MKEGQKYCHLRSVTGCRHFKNQIPSEGLFHRSYEKKRVGRARQNSMRRSDSHSQVFSSYSPLIQGPKPLGSVILYISETKLRERLEVSSQQRSGSERPGWEEVGSDTVFKRKRYIISKIREEDREKKKEERISFLIDLYLIISDYFMSSSEYLRLS